MYESRMIGTRLGPERKRQTYGTINDRSLIGEGRLEVRLSFLCTVTDGAAPGVDDQRNLRSGGTPAMPIPISRALRPEGWIQQIVNSLSLEVAVVWPPCK
jgi:hypothetical protein